MKQSLKKAGVAGTLTLLAFGALSASAMGFPGKGMTTDEIVTAQSAMFTRQASLIGATADEVKDAWANGTSFEKLAESKGVTKEQLQAKMKTEHEAQMKEQLAALVSKGVITQAQADKRLATMQAKETNKSNTGKGEGCGKHGGMGNFLGF